MFEEVINHIYKQGRNSRNPVFIDSYGYKEIKKSTLERLLQNERTEIILFLPISEMQRFTAVALESDLESYKPLRNFVDSFLRPRPVSPRTARSASKTTTKPAFADWFAQERRRKQRVKK